MSKKTRPGKNKRNGKYEKQRVRTSANRKRKMLAYIAKAPNDTQCKNRAKELGYV